MRARIEDVLVADARVAAVWLTGSFGRGQDDEWSDFDLHVAVHDAELAQFIAELPELYQKVGSPILVQQPMPSNAQAGGHFQLVWFDGPAEVDWNIGPLSLAVRPRWSLMLFARADIPIEPLRDLTADLHERTTFFWAMAPIAVKYAARKQTRRAVAMIDLMTSAFVPAWRLVHGAQHGINMPLEAELAAALPRLGETIDPRTCLDVIERLCNAMTSFAPNDWPAMPAALDAEIRLAHARIGE